MISTLKKLEDLKKIADYSMYIMVRPILRHGNVWNIGVEHMPHWAVRDFSNFIEYWAIFSDN